MEQTSWPVLTLLTLSQLVPDIANVQITDLLLPDTFQGNPQLPAPPPISASSLQRELRLGCCLTVNIIIQSKIGTRLK